MAETEKEDCLVLKDNGSNERFTFEYNGKYITDEITLFFGKPGNGAVATIHSKSGDIKTDNILFQRFE